MIDDYIPIAKFGDRPPVAIFTGGIAFDNDGQRLRKGTKRYKEIVGE